jgi:pimeloyl-ACP methyl ester carboxylesterase
VRIQTASGHEIEAWLYLPEGDGPHPAVVMAHGIGAIKAGGLAPFAERFRRESFAAVAFDYRQWGRSTGQPREELSVPRERKDYSIVTGWTAAQPDIDVQRIFAWGTSFAGMHIVELAASDSRLAGALAQSPLVDGLAAAAMAPPLPSLRLFSLAVRDRLGSILGRTPRYLPGAGAPGELAVGANEDALFGEKLMTPKDSTEWHDRVAERSLLSFSWRRPVRRTASIRCPSCSSSPSTTRWRRSVRPSASPRTLPMQSSAVVAAATTTSTKAAKTTTTCCASRSNSSTDTHDFSRDELANEVVARDS